MATPEKTPCPSCGELTLTVGWMLQAKPLGTFSLAGNQMKFSAVRQLRWKCGNCLANGPAEGK